MLGSWETFQKADESAGPGDTKLFEQMTICRKFPYFDVKVVEHPEGSRALSKAEQLASRYAGQTETASDDMGLGKLGLALKSIADGFLTDPNAPLPGSPSKPEMKKVQIKKLKAKYGIWTYPKKDPAAVPDAKENEVMKKELFYLMENSISQRQLGRIEEGQLEGVENFLNNIFFSNFSHKDDCILVIPLQSEQCATKPAGSNDPSNYQSSLLRKVNQDLVSYHVVYYKPDFTVLDGEFYRTDLFIRIKTLYPFFSFFSQLLNLLLSRQFFPQMKPSSSALSYTASSIYRIH
jgi:hypothetical protein